MNLKFTKSKLIALMLGLTGWMSVMTSMTGAVVKTMKSANTGLIQVDASDLSEGVYLVQVMGGNHVASQKITIAK